MDYDGVQKANLARVTPYTFQRISWDFCIDHRGSGPLFNVSSKGKFFSDSIVSLSLYCTWALGPTVH